MFHLISCSTWNRGQKPFQAFHSCFQSPRSTIDTPPNTSSCLDGLTSLSLWSICTKMWWPTETNEFSTESVEYRNEKMEPGFQSAYSYIWGNIHLHSRIQTYLSSTSRLWREGSLDEIVSVSRAVSRFREAGVVHSVIRWPGVPIRSEEFRRQSERRLFLTELLWPQCRLTGCSSLQIRGHSSTRRTCQFLKQCEYIISSRGGLRLDCWALYWEHTPALPDMLRRSWGTFPPWSKCLLMWQETMAKAI